MSSHKSLQGEVQKLSSHKSPQGAVRELSPPKSLQGEGQELIFSLFHWQPWHVHTEPSVQSISASKVSGTELGLDLEQTGQMEGLILVPFTPGNHRDTTRWHSAIIVYVLAALAWIFFWIGPTALAWIFSWICPAALAWIFFWISPAALSSLHQELSADTALHCPSSKTLLKSPQFLSKGNSSLLNSLTTSPNHSFSQNSSGINPSCQMRGVVTRVWFSWHNSGLIHCVPREAESDVGVWS